MPSSSPPSRGLITGATGFIGSRLMQHLDAAGWQLAVLSRSGLSPLPGKQSFSYSGRTEEVMRAVEDFRPDIVFHLASLFLAQHTPADVEPLISANVLLGTQLLEAMRVAGVRRMVNAGTGWQNYAGDSYLPVNLYAATKQAFDDILVYYVETADLRAVTLKLFDSYGPGDTRRKLLRLLLDTFRTGTDLAMSAGEQVIDLAHVDDICGAFLRAAQLTGEMIRPSADIYAVSGGQRRTLREIVATLEDVAGRPLPILWGARPYREREVMLPWMGPELPGWRAQITLEEGLRGLLLGEGLLDNERTS